MSAQEGRLGDDQVGKVISKGSLSSGHASTEIRPPYSPLESIRFRPVSTFSRSGETA